MGLLGKALGLAAASGLLDALENTAASNYQPPHPPQNLQYRTIIKEFRSSSNRVREYEIFNHYGGLAYTVKQGGLFSQNELKVFDLCGRTVGSVSKRLNDDKNLYAINCPLGSMKTDRSLESAFNFSKGTYVLSHSKLKVQFNVSNLGATKSQYQVINEFGVVVISITSALANIVDDYSSYIFVDYQDVNLELAGCVIALALHSI